MESAVVSSDAVAVEPRAERVLVSRCGRFSTGMERLPETPGARRVGRFSDGVERVADSPERALLGRFSVGMEQWPDPAERLRVGSFADGYARSVGADLAR